MQQTRIDDSSETLYQHVGDKVGTDTFELPCKKWDKTFEDAESKLKHVMEIHCSKGSDV